MASASARNSALVLRMVAPVGVLAERYFSLWVFNDKPGKRDEEEVKMGTKDSSWPRDGVVAVSVPDGVAVRKVPLRQNSAYSRKGTG